MRKPNKEDDDCTVYASARYGATSQGGGGGATIGNASSGSGGNFEATLRLKRRNLVADLTARFQAFMREKGHKKGEDLWKRPKKKRDKSLCREMDEVVIARPISTDRKFLESLVDKKCSDIAAEARYSSVIREHTHDVRTAMDGGRARRRGSQKAYKIREVKLNSEVYISTECGHGGYFPKIQKICGHHMCLVPQGGAELHRRARNVLETARREAAHREVYSDCWK